MKRRTLTDIGVATLKPRAARYTVPDPELRGHYVRVAPTGAKAFLTVTRAPSGKQVWTTIGPVDALSIEQARIKARDVLTRVRAGMSIEPAKASTFEAVADSWRERHVQKNGLRSEREVTRLLRVHVYPAWKEREFLSIRRSDMAALLDHVEDNHSARQADYVLNVVRSIMNWYATRNDDYTPPIVRGMRRQNPQAQARARILSDDEVRLIWKAAEANGTFGGILRLCLLTAQRSRKVTGMRWLDVSVDGEWTIPAEAREKGTGGSLVLPEAAISIIRAQPRMETNPFVFAGRGGGAFAGFSQAKTRFDAKLPAMPPWVIHDLRRSARSLMSRAGIRPDVAERVMGHVISGVEGVYDRHHYREEKADALRRLAAPYRKHREPADRKRSVSQRERVMGIKRSKPIWKVSRAVRAKAARDLIIKISSAQAATALRQGDWDPLIKHFEQGLPLTDELRPLLIRILKPDLKRPQNRHPKNETLQRGMRMAARAYQLEHPHLILRDIEEELKHIPESDTRHREILTAFARRFEADAKKKVNETVAAEFRCSVRTVTNARKKFRIG